MIDAISNSCGVRQNKFQFTLMNWKEANSSIWSFAAQPWYLHIQWYPFFLHLFHMHTLISHQYSPPELHYASASVPVESFCLDTMISSWQTSHDTARWAPGSHLNFCMRSNQSRRQSNQTGPPRRLLCPLYAWWHRPGKMEKRGFNLKEVMGQEEGIMGVIRECKMSWSKHGEYESRAQKSLTLQK